MGIGDTEIDITKNIKIIEMLKSRLLTRVSDLYNNMSEDYADAEARADILADLLMITYLLSDRLGVGNNTLDLRVINKLKLAVLEEDSVLHGDVTNLLKYMYRNQNFKG